MSGCSLQFHPYDPDEGEPEEEPEETVDLTAETSIEENSEISPIVVPETQTIAIDNSYQIEITYDQIPKINICVIPPVTRSQRVSCISLISPPASPPKVREKSNEEKQQNLISILKKFSDKLEKTPTKKKTVNFLLPTPPRHRQSARLSGKSNEPPAVGNAFFLSQKFFIVIESFFTNYIKDLKFLNEAQPLLRRFFHWAKTIDIYLKLLKASVMISKKRQNDSSTAGGSAEGSSKPKKNVSSSEEYSKKLHRKLADNRSLIMQNERNKCTIEKDCSYSFTYFERVKKTLTENGDDELYTQLMSMLTSFDPEVESVPELYHKLEKLLMPNYSDLLDLFLTFLLPEHAAEVGKFFEHFVLNNMKNLLHKLNGFFSKQPSQMKKIYACLNELSNEKEVTMEQLKARMLPLLKGNQLLIDWFMELFDKPLASLPSEFESVYIKKSLSDSDSSIDNYEELHSKDLIECGNIDDLNACGVRYKNGKIMYQGTLLPAKISFLAHDAPSLSAVKSDEKSLCSHEIRKHVKFNDPKKPEDASEANKKPKSAAKKYKLCDAPTLHAHAVRLNSVHAHNGEKLSDLSHLLTASTMQNTSGAETSPKKARNGKKSGSSPKKNKSPSSSSSNPVNISPPTPSPSKALQTAKKLRNLIGDSSDEPSKKKTKVAEPSEANPKVVTSVRSLDKTSKKSQTKTDDAPTTSNEKRGTGDWKRDEDKIILEEIKVGYADKKDLLDVLVTKLSRKRSEINERYEFLFDILMMMEN